MVQYSSNLIEYKIISLLGKCFESKASVFLAKHDPSKSLVALKKFNMDTIKEDSYLVDLEIILTKQLHHPNILPYFTSFVHEVNVYVIAPLMAYGSCRDLLNLHFNEGLPEQAIIIILRDVLDAVNYLHKKGYIHRAIRASHILISSLGKICLTGFRYSCPMVVNGRWQKTIHSFPSTTKPNLNWLSPELLEQNLIGYNEKSDIYSIGMLICELANGSEPFAGMTKTLMLTEKVRGSIPQLLDCTTMPKNDNVMNDGEDCDISYNIINRRFSDDLHKITESCLNQQPYYRPTAEHLITDPIFKTIRKSIPLTDLLKPALPLSDKVASNLDEIESLGILSNFSNMEIDTSEWNF